MSASIVARGPANVRMRFKPGLVGPPGDGTSSFLDYAATGASTDRSINAEIRSRGRTPDQFFDGLDLNNTVHAATAIQRAIDWCSLYNQPLYFNRLYYISGSTPTIRRPITMFGNGISTGIRQAGARPCLEIEVPNSWGGLFGPGSVKDFTLGHEAQVAGSVGLRLSSASGGNPTNFVFWDIDITVFGSERCFECTRTEVIPYDNPDPARPVGNQDWHIAPHGHSTIRVSGFPNGVGQYPAKVIKFVAGWGPHMRLDVPQAQVGAGGVVVEAGDSVNGLGDCLIVGDHWNAPPGTGTGVRLSGPAGQYEYNESITIMTVQMDGGISVGVQANRVRELVIDPSVRTGGNDNNITNSDGVSVTRKSRKSEYGIRRINSSTVGSHTIGLIDIGEMSTYAGCKVEISLNGVVAGVGAFEADAVVRIVRDAGTDTATVSGAAGIGATATISTAPVTVTGESFTRISLTIAPTIAGSVVSGHATVIGDYNRVHNLT